jgi:hypothetical protein
MKSSDLKFSLSTDKNEFQEGEPVRCKMVLANSGSGPMYVNKRFLVNFPDMRHDVYFEITDSQGRSAPFGLLVNAGLLEARHFEELKPQDSVSKEIDLASDFKMDPGSYKVKAIYENDSAPPQLDTSRVWKGKTESNTLNITIH